MTTIYPPESIYNLIPREEVRFETPPRYTSKFRDQVKQEKQSGKAAHRTMGPTKVETPSPEKFLRKHSKEPRLPEKKQFVYMDGDKLRKPPIPARTEIPKMGVHSAKDFIRDNTIKNLLSAPRQPQPIYADTKHGDKQPLECSGLVPKYLKKKDYGQIPEYLLQRKVEEGRAQEEYDEYVKERVRQGAMKQLSDEERLSTLQGLKKNWEELHHQYQALSIVTDTGPKKYIKEKLEMQMKQLEKDIDLIERHKTIYIANN
ncbi:enkurin-like [Anguilla anguilla]|uniref:Enkurin domain-containing protein n=1 Tax=Anguilla anguilla TaxID=7936 RepID=A0A9D3MKL3_ANGAN|nr:enkurin-like [Anguilla anguilla]KAG5850445.1 hypothetical protein ANANG_G00082520 [Anguilla anguilla]